MKTVLKNPWVRFAGLLVLLYLGLRVLSAIRGVLIPFTLALIAAYIFDPVVDWLERKKIGRIKLRRGVAVGLLVGAFALLVALFLFVAVPSAVLSAKGWLEDQRFEDVKGWLPDQWRTGIEAWLKSTPDERRAIVSRVVADLSAREAVRDTVGQSLRAITLSTFEAVLWVFQFLLFFVVTIYLLIDLDRVRERAKDMVPLKHKDAILRITRQIDVNLKAFFRGQIVVVLALSAIFTVGLAIVQCPFWYIIGVAGGLGAFIPYFALASGMVPAMIVSAAKHGGVLHPLLAAAVFGIGLAIDNAFITPKVIGKRVGLHPVIIILSILVFGTLFGFLGVLFAVPIAAVVKVIVQELLVRYKASELYTGEPPSGPAEEAPP